MCARNHKVQLQYGLVKRRATDAADAVNDSLHELTPASTVHSGVAQASRQRWPTPALFSSVTSLPALKTNRPTRSWPTREEHDRARLDTRKSGMPRCRVHRTLPGQKVGVQLSQTSKDVLRAHHGLLAVLPPAGDFSSVKRKAV